MRSLGTALAEAAEKPSAYGPDAQRMRGRLRRWVDDMRFGIIQTETACAGQPKGERFFVHASMVENVKALRRGAVIEFEAAMNDRGRYRRAVKARVVG